MDGRDDRMTVLVNPAAGRGGSAGCRQLASALRANGIEAELRLLPATALPDVVSELLAGGASLVAVAGGDGTVRAAAERLIGRAATLAVLPMGTLNHFARRLGIADLETAVAALAGRATTRVAVGIVDDRVFLNTATFGQYAAVVRRRERLRRWMGKWPAAGFAFARTLRRLHPISLAVDLPEGPVERVSPLLWVGMGRATFPRPSRGAVPADEEALEVVIAHVRTRRAAFAFLARLFVRAVRERPSTGDRVIEMVHTRSLLLRRPHFLEATLDGELFRFAAPVAVSVQDAALDVVVPVGS